MTEGYSNESPKVLPFVPEIVYHGAAVSMWDPSVVYEFDLYGHCNNHGSYLFHSDYMEYADRCERFFTMLRWVFPS